MTIQSQPYVAKVSTAGMPLTPGVTPPQPQLPRFAWARCLLRPRTGQCDAVLCDDVLPLRHGRQGGTPLCGVWGFLNTFHVANVDTHGTQFTCIARSPCLLRCRCGHQPGDYHLCHAAAAGLGALYSGAEHGVVLADDRLFGVHDLPSDHCRHDPDPHAAPRWRPTHGCSGPLQFIYALIVVGVRW